MATYTIFKDYVLFHKHLEHPHPCHESMKIAKELILQCADKIERNVPVPDNYQPIEKTGGTHKFSNMILCPSCNNYGYPSTYTEVKPEGTSLDLCTSCANRMRTDGLHIVNQETMTIRLRRTVKDHKYSSDDIYQKVIQAGKKVKEKGEWQLRACAGCEIEYENFGCEVTGCNFDARGSRCPICKKSFRHGCNHSVPQAEARLFENYVRAIAKNE